MTDSHDKIERTRKIYWLITLFVLGGGCAGIGISIVVFITKLAQKLNGI